MDTAMVDIHSHVLPGLDDGSPDMETSVAMCKIWAEEGVTDAVGTPHCSDEFEYNLERNLELRAQLQEKIGPSPRLVTGCDFHFNEPNLNLLFKDPHRYTINQKNYLLVENSNYGLPPNMDQMFFQLRSKGIIPVLTHPERNPIWREDTPLLRKVADNGVIQVTAGSITGRFGHRSQKCAIEWLRLGLIHVIASDAHNTDKRPPRLKEAYAAVAEETSPEVADLLFTHNPRAIINGEDCQRPPMAPPRKKFLGIF